MKVLVCFKTVANTDKVPATGWEEASKTGNYDFPEVDTIIDPQSASALEMALKLKDQDKDDEVHLTALSVGNEKCEEDLKLLGALGFNDIYRIESDTSPHPVVSSYAISGFCMEHGPFDLILMGDKSPEVGSGKTPLIVAELLASPCLIEICDLTLLEPDPDPDEPLYIRVRKEADYNMVTETLRLPFVATIGDVPGTLLRTPTPEQQKAAEEQKIQVIPLSEVLEDTDWEDNISDQGLAKNAELLSLTPVNQERSGKVYHGEEAVTEVWEEHLKGKVM